ncbi:ATP-binding protein [Pseudomonas baltica]|uniref:PAS domain-containing hybrid sensor histidine kinase/response regulator n=1 Tax=Pseudomonas baltica TaxID=2762576 RepID=UPI002897B14A|nr:ATP-binding protein [Pseudomonas baltica]
MSYRAPQDIALDLALGALLDTQVREGHYASIADARRAAASILQRHEVGGRDVTAEQASDTALYDSMDFARLALSAVSGVGVWTYEVSNDCFYCDEGVSELYGIDAEQAAAGIKRAEFLANVHPDDLFALRKTMAGGLVTSGDLELEYRIVHPDGSIRWVLSRGHTYFNTAGEPVRRTGVGVEMTAQRLLEQQLRQSQKMEAVGQLTGGLAHDFNNLLTGVMGSLEMVRLRIAEGRVADVERYLNAAQGASNRAAALTHRLLAFSRRQTLEASPTDIARLVQGMLELIRSTVGPSVHIDTQSESNLWLTQVDANQLENALLNLCINARDAMPAGGTLTISTANCTLYARAAAERDLPPGEYLTLSVRDTGSGMTSDVIAHAFDPFFTTKPTGEGTGLGLSMIYGFVRQSGGSVQILSQLEVGTQMTLYLPRSRAEATPCATPSAPALPSALGQGETVLVIDDEPTVRMLITEVLEDLGYTALEAADGATGLEVLQRNPQIDLLVTDVGLPGGINGRQVADAGRTLRPDLKVLFITGYAHNAATWEEQLAPGMHLLTKPFSMDDLTSRIKGVIGS